ncbi:hypothetical protein ACROYT_G007531 [Oculina patagonica]
MRSPEVRMARPSGVLLCLLFAAVIGEFCLADSEVDQCIKGPAHKDKPSPEGPGYVECLPWKKSACCTAKFTAELKRSNVEVLYNFSWNHCQNLSKACERYIKNEECFWQCEPNLIKWHVKDGALQGVPICADYCDNWFDACKDDFTCAEDWINDFNYTSSVYSCPKASKCRNFSEIYTDGKGLCEKMWGNSFIYEKSDNCMVMWFNGTNPNGDVKPKPTSAPNPTSAATCHSKFIYPAVILSLINLLLNSY